MIYQVLKGIIYALVGSALGIIIDKIFKSIQDKIRKKENIILISLVQIIISVIILLFIEVYISKAFAIEWQGTTAGLFFVAFFFGVQTNLYTNIRTVFP
jgi:hypothetical protein